jgi:hypothetical protein
MCLAQLPCPWSRCTRHNQIDREHLASSGVTKIKDMNVILWTLLFSISMHDQPSTRKLLLFGEGQAELQEQLSLLEQDSAGMVERDLFVVVIDKDSDYQKYKIKPNQFALLLIGKDGGEKLRSTRPVELKSIFGLIDSMPMRQAEKAKRESDVN